MAIHQCVAIGELQELGGASLAAVHAAIVLRVHGLAALRAALGISFLFGELREALEELRFGRFDSANQHFLERHDDQRLPIHARLELSKRRPQIGDFGWRYMIFDVILSHGQAPLVKCGYFVPWYFYSPSAWPQYSRVPWCKRAPTWVMTFMARKQAARAAAKGGTWCVTP